MSSENEAAAAGTEQPEVVVVDSGVDTESGGTIVVGGYTASMDGIAVGLMSYRWNASDAEAVDLVANEPLPLASPSWVEVHPSQPRVHAVSEEGGSHLAAVAVALETGELTLINAVETGGRGGCHLAYSPDGRFIVVAHYGDGSIASFAVADDGSVSGPLDSKTFNQVGADILRQDMSHAHQVVWDGDGFWVVNLGGDTVHFLQLDDEGHFVSTVAPIELPAGCGPRHLVRVGDHLVVACELTAQVWVGRRTGDGWHQVALVDSTTRERNMTDNRVYPSGIAAYGTEVLVANRGCDTIAVFDLDAEADTLTYVTEFECGEWPRDLKVFGDRMWVACQVDNVVTTFVRDTDPAVRWQRDFEFATASPACVAMVAATASEGAR
ncbi:lactonase family protein [Propionibacteriaceae bacterium Y2011]|uniref:lactonase family protein n=1 Tax=Microlunatus sp. Y2014 TaxID=3418488 RepID=UPI003B4C3A23